MKKLIYLIFLLLFVGVYSCGNSGKEKEKASKEEVKTSNGCDEFLTNYEAWIDDYLKVVEDYFNSPTDETLAARYMEIMQEAAEWSTKWITLIDCAEDEKYEKKFEEISKKFEGRLKELQL